MSLRHLATGLAVLVAVSRGEGGQLGPRVAIGHRGGEETHVGWSRSEERCAGSELASFTVYLKQQGLDRLDSIFEAVSDPRSPQYGQFLSKQEVDELVFARPAAKSAVLTWLAAHGVEEVEVRSDAIVARTNCTTASHLFDVPFHAYTQGHNGQTRMLFHGEATLPLELAEHVDFVSGISELWHGRPLSRPSAKVQRDASDLTVTPKLLRQYYNVPDDETNPSPSNYQAVIAFDDYFSQSALEEFYKSTDGGLGASPVLETQGLNCLASGCDQFESDLDVQYMTAMSGRGSVKTLFHNAATADGWVLGFSENAQKFSPMPMVMSLSYGWMELKNCQIASSVCTSLGYSSQQYVERTNVNFQKLAAMGISILVSSGDDGAQGVSPPGWDPLDMDHWCPTGACSEASSECGEVVVRNTGSGEECVFPTGFSSCSFDVNSVAQALRNDNPSCNVAFYQDRSGGAFMYSACKCGELSLKDGNFVAKPLTLDTTKRLFWPDFPTSSPYVTSVGATAFKTLDGRTVSAEHAASIKDGSIITTGGGFSDVFKTPAWQEAALKAYLAGSTQKPPAGTFDTSARAYPDVALNGHNYQIYYSSGGRLAATTVDGTSASSPATAGLISLINGHRLASGKSQLGFLNPLLYGALTADAGVFHDITVGDNKCTRDQCGQYGYSAGKGWDPVGGVGSIDYAKLKKYALGNPSVIV